MRDERGRFQEGVVRVSSSKEDIIVSEMQEKGEEVGVQGRMRRPRGPLTTILFDVDGTLCDSDPLHEAVFRELFVNEGVNGGIPIDKAFFKAHLSGRSNAAITCEFFPTWDIAKREDWSAMKEQKFRESARAGLTPMEGLVPLLEHCKRTGVHMAAVTNAPRLNAELMLDALKVADFFETLVIGEECAQPKPFPDPYLTALNHFDDSAKQSVLIVEDSRSGIAAGVAAGVPVCGVTGVLSADELMDAGAVMTIDSYDDAELWKLLSPK